MIPATGIENFYEGMDVRGEEFRNTLNRMGELTAEFARMKNELDRVITMGEAEEEGQATVGDTIAIKIDPAQTVKAQLSKFAGQEAADSDDNPVRWFYKAFQVAKVSPGYNGWAKDETGWKGDAFNLCEFFNNGESVEGNGINISNLLTNFQGAFKFQPFPAGRVFWARLVAVKGVAHRNEPESTLEAWFDSNNAVDGTCAPVTEA